MEDQAGNRPAPPDAGPRPGVAPPGATPGVAGWYADPFSNTRRRWWTGHAWTFSTAEPSGPAPPPPPAPEVSAPVLPPPGPAETWTGKLRRLAGRHRVLVAVAVGLLIGLAAVRIMSGPDRRATGDGSGSALGRGRTGTTTPHRMPTTPASPTVPTAPSDPSAFALESLVVQPGDVAASSIVTLLPGGDGLTQPTLDLCNGTFPSEDRRTARLQNMAIDDQGSSTLSTEAVLYADSAGAMQALTELKAAAAACPSTPVPGPSGAGGPTTRINGAPDGDWPQTATVNRLAFDLTTTDWSGQATRIVAVYLQRGRALLGVYFYEPDGPQDEVAGQTTMAGIVGVFATRLADLPSSVVGS